MKKQGLENRKFRKLLAKEEEKEEVQKDVQRLCAKDVKVVMIVLEMQVKVLLL